jgi:hypothetical protein
MMSTLGNGLRGMDELHCTHGRSLEMWYNDTAKFPLKTHVLFIQVLHENPGHCISDYMLPVIRDRYERRTLLKHPKLDPSVSKLGLNSQTLGTVQPEVLLHSGLASCWFC